MKKAILSLLLFGALFCTIGIFSSQGRPAGSHVPAGWINVCDYGAGPQKSAAANTTAIHNAIADMTAGMTLYVPPGTFNVTNVVFDPPSGCMLKMEGKFLSAAAGIALRIGGPSGAWPTTVRNNYDCRGVWVESAGMDWTAGRVGVRIANLMHSAIHFREVYGFESGLELDPDGSNGITYNSFYNGYFLNNKYNISIKSAVGGWTKENTFYSPTLRGDDAPAGSSQADSVWLLMGVGVTHLLDNIRFYSPCFEGHGTAKVAEVRGYAISIMQPRVEMNLAPTLANGIEICADSYYANVDLGTHYDEPLIVDNGLYSRVTSNWGRSLSFKDTEGSAFSVNGYDNYADPPNASTFPLLSVKRLGVEKFNVKKVAWSNALGGGVSLGDVNSEPGIVFGNVDPSAGSGLASGLGSLYIRRHTAIIFDNFERGPEWVSDYTLAGWTGISVQSTIKSYVDAGLTAPTGGGKHCVELSGARYVRRDGADYGTEIWVETLARCGDCTTSKTSIFRATDGSKYPQLSFAFTGDVNPPVLRGYTGAAWVNGSTQVVPGTWYHVKCRIVKSATVGVFQAWLNGALEIDESGINNGADAFTRVSIGDGDGTDQTGYFDYFKVSASDAYGGELWMKTGIEDTKWTKVGP